MMRIGLAVSLLLAVAAVVAVWWGGWRWRVETAALVERLRRGELAAAPAFGDADLDGLPPPVVRYFRRVLRAGQPLVTRARIRWAGEFNMGSPGRDRWRPFTADQEFVPGAPGFVWDARISMGPGLAVLVRDGFVDGAGSMRGLLAGLYPVVDAAGTPALASGALQRYLGEAAWLPTALLPRQGVRWTPIDDLRALAQLSVGGVSVTLEFHFDAEGRNVAVYTSGRMYDDGRHPPELRPWRARTLGHTTVDGMMVGESAVAEWDLPTGTYAYWRGRPVSITYTWGATD